MAFSSTAAKSLAVGAALTLALAGCGASNSQSASTSSASTSSASTVEQKVSTTKFNDVASAEEAAKGAGLEKFGVMDKITLDGKEFKDPKFSYADGVAQAIYETDGITLVVRKGASKHSAPITDADLASFANKWNKDYEELAVTLYGPSKGAASVLTWNDSSLDYGVTYQSANNDQTIDSDEANEVVKAIKEANAAEEEKKDEQQNNNQQQNNNNQQQQQNNNQQQQQNNNGGDGNVPGVTVSSDQATEKALSFFGAGGAAKGPANNVSVRGPIEGGGTTYYAISFNLGDATCSCNVDATDGHIYAASETVNGIETNLDENGNPDLVYDHNTGEQVS